MKKKIVLSSIVIATFLAARYIKYFWAYAVFGKEGWNALDKAIATNILVYSQITLVSIVTFLLFKKQLFKSLGINSGILKGIAIGFLCSLPMFIGYAITSNFNLSINLQIIHRDMIQAGFFEEFIFRGFLFGLLFYYAGWGFIPAVILPSIYFGIGHLYQANSFNESISVFLFTGLASAGFAWFYTAWRNLWVVIFLHGFMDLAWDIFGIETNVVGNLSVNIFRFASLGLMIFLSMKNLKKHPEFSIKDKLWLNKTDS